MVKVFVEGGAKGSLKAKCREGFTKFFEKAGLKGKMPRIVACGSRSHAYNDFCTALAQAKSNDVIVLLVDSESPVTVSEDQVWQHVLHREGDKWQQPVGAEPEHLHFMVECMEAWFMADKNCLAAYFGQGFDVGKLPKQSNIEKIAKIDLYAGLENATKNCKTKSCYGKGSHSFDILCKIDASKVVSASNYAKRLLNHLKIQ